MLRVDRIDGLEQLIGQGHVDAVDIFLQLFERRGADQVAGDRGLLVYPGQCEVRGRQAMIACQFHILLGGRFGLRIALARKTRK